MGYGLTDLLTRHVEARETRHDTEDGHGPSALVGWMQETSEISKMGVVQLITPRRQKLR